MCGGGERQKGAKQISEEITAENTKNVKTDTSK